MLMMMSACLGVVPGINGSASYKVGIVVFIRIERLLAMANLPVLWSQNNCYAADLLTSGKSKGFYGRPAAFEGEKVTVPKGIFMGRCFR